VRPYRVKPGSGVFSAGLAEVSSSCNAVGAVFPLPVEFFLE